MSQHEATDAQKQRKGLSRMGHAFGYSLAGLRAGWGETAFRQEALAAMVMLPAAWWLGKNWVEELLNTGIESAIDRIGPEWHVLAKRAKDMGSAAVLLSLLGCGGIWIAALWARWVV